MLQRWQGERQSKIQTAPVTATETDFAEKSEIFNDGKYEKVDQDSEGNFALDYMLQQQESPPIGKPATPLAPLHSTPTSAPNQHRKAEELSTEQAFMGFPEPVFPSRWKRYKKVDSPSETDSFEALRRHHSQQAYLPQYEPPSDLVPSVTPQPHGYRLTSRYDWRLRAPSQASGQKDAYGGKITWRKKDARALVVTDLPGLEEYQDAFRRFIQLERQEAQDAALARLKRLAVRDLETPPQIHSLPGYSYQENIVGLKSVVRKPGASIMKKGKTTHMPTDLNGIVKPLHANATEALTHSLNESDADSKHMRKDWVDDIVDTEGNSGGDVIVSFMREGHEDLPDNPFKPGKMVFIWRCQRNPHGSGLYVPELTDSTKTWEELRPLPIRGFVQQSYRNRLDIKCPATFTKTSEGQFFR